MGSVTGKSIAAVAVFVLVAATACGSGANDSADGSSTPGPSEPAVRTGIVEPTGESISQEPTVGTENPQPKLEGDVSISMGGPTATTIPPPAASQGPGQSCQAVVFQSSAPLPRESGKVVVASVEASGGFVVGPLKGKPDPCGTSDSCLPERDVFSLTAGAGPACDVAVHWPAAEVGTTSVLRVGSLDITLVVRCPLEQWCEGSGDVSVRLEGYGIQAPGAYVTVGASSST